MQLLGECSLLRDLPTDGLEALAKVARRRTLQQDEFIYRRGEVQSTLCVIATGSVRLSSLTVEGREAVLVILNAGSWFGDAVFSPGHPRVYDALAHEVTEVLDVPGETFRQVLDRYPQAYPRVVKLLSRRLLSTMAIIEDDALRDTLTRIARRLMFLARMHTGRREPTESVTFRLTREHIANMMGMTRQGVHAVLRQMADEELIELGYGRVTIPDPARLQAYIDKRSRD